MRPQDLKVLLEPLKKLPWLCVLGHCHAGIPIQDSFSMLWLALMPWPWQYMPPTIVPLMRCSCPVPVAEKHPQSLTFPPPCLCSSPLLSLVTSTSEISHPPVHTYATYIWQRGRQNRKTGYVRKIQHLHEEREEEKKMFTPRLCSIGTVWEQKKNTSAQKHIYHKHMTCNRGNISSSGKQPSGPVPFITAPVADLLDRWRYKAFGGSWSGRGVMSVMGEGSKSVYSASLSQGSSSSMTLAKPAGTGEPEKIRLNFVVSFGANRCVSSQLYSLCPFWSLKSSIFTYKAVSFNMTASIFRFIVSVSLLTALPTASIKTGILVRLWTAVPVFRIFR